MRRALFTACFTAAAALALAFCVFPVAAIFAHVPPDRLARQLGQPVVVDALVVSLKTTLLAQLLIVLVGTPAAYVLARSELRGRSLALTLVELPLVLPPAVAGLGLLAAFGRLGLLGPALGHAGVHLAFTQAAVTIAVAFVASPLYVRQAVASFEAVDPNLVAAARTLGARPARTFFRVVLPLAASGLAAGEALAFARGLGEFGATIMFAGSLRGVTQTLPLAIYGEFSVDFDTTLAMGALLVVVSVALLLTLKLVLQWRPSPRPSSIPFARSASA